MRGGEGQVVGDDLVLIAALSAVPRVESICIKCGSGARAFAKCFTPCKSEDAVAGVRATIQRNDVVGALFEQQNSSRVLPARIDAVGVATDAEVETVSRNRVGTAAPHCETPPGEEGAIVVVDLRSVHTSEQDAVLSVVILDAANRDVLRVRDRHARAVLLRPLAFIVLVREEPIRGSFFPWLRFQELRVVVARIEIFKHESIATVALDRDFEPFDFSITKRHILSRHDDTDARQAL